MTGKRYSKRREQALAAQKARERKQRLEVGGIAIVVLAVLGGLLWLANRPKVAETEPPTAADGMAWGPADAPVLIQEWSDFN